MTFKRNQVEEALSKLREPKARRPSLRLRTQLKRFLEIDRARGRSARSAVAGSFRYAFFSTDPPGRGVEVYFSDYEAFALLLAFKMTQLGWTQKLAVSILRRARPALEKQYAHILKLCRDNRIGTLDFATTSPLLVVMTANESNTSNGMKAFACTVCEGYQKAMQWVFDNSERTYGFSMFELAANAQNLSTELARTIPRRRGQAG